MRQQHDKQDFYELRPLMFILFGLVGTFNSLFTQSTPGMIYFGQFCGLMLFFFSFKILSWRKEYRKKLHL